MTIDRIGAQIPFRRTRDYREDGTRRTGSAVLDRLRDEFLGDAGNRLEARSSEFQTMGSPRTKPPV